MYLLSAYEPAIALACIGLLALAMLLVIVLDVSRYIIPNSLNAAILVLYVFAAFLLHLPWATALLAALLMLVVGLGLFALGLMGGGDIKLLVVLTLWTGWSMATADFLMLTAMAGGLLVIAVLILRAFAGRLFPAGKGKTLPRILMRKQPVPYGVAIALAFLAMLALGTVPGLPKVF
jgi:prepilin peptidase CpaA